MALIDEMRRQEAQSPNRRAAGIDMSALAQQQDRQRQSNEQAIQNLAQAQAESDASVASSSVPITKMHSAGSRNAAEMLSAGLDSGARSFFDSFQKKPEAPAASAAPAAPAAPNPTDQRLAAGTQAPQVAPAPASTPAPAAPGSTSIQVMPGVFQHGRGQYSDQAEGMGFKEGFTGYPNAQSLTAADNLAARPGLASYAATTPAATSGSAGVPLVQAAGIRHSGNDWQARNDLRNLQVSASSIMNNGGPWDKHKGVSPERAAYEAAVATDQTLKGAQPGMDQEAMRQNAGLQRESIHQQGANARAMLSGGIDAGRLAIEQERQGIASRDARQIDAQRRIAIDPRSTAEQRTAAERALVLLGGKQPAADPHLVVPGGQQIDPVTQRAYNTPSSVFNRQTGQWIQQPGQGGVSPSPAAMAALRADPKRAAEFDAKFGPGAARAALGS